MLEESWTLLHIYNTYARKIFEKTNDPEIKLLLLVFYYDKDLKEFIERMKAEREEFLKKINEENSFEAYLIYKQFEKDYNEFKNRIYERIESLVKIRALDIARKSLNSQ